MPYVIIISFEINDIFEKVLVTRNDWSLPPSLILVRFQLLATKVQDIDISALSCIVVHCLMHSTPTYVSLMTLGTR